MTPRCDGCRYWVWMDVTVPITELSWDPRIGGITELDARIRGWCRRFPRVEVKAPADWCGEYVARAADDEARRRAE